MFFPNIVVPMAFSTATDEIGPNQRFEPRLFHFGTGRGGHAAAVPRRGSAAAAWQYRRWCCAYTNPNSRGMWRPPSRCGRDPKELLDAIKAERVDPARV
jgi:hypothetical protein